MKRVLCFLAVLLYAFGIIEAQTVTVSGSHVQDAAGNLCASCRITFAPVDANGRPLSFRVGGTGGQALSKPVSADVTNGVFTITLPDVSETSPVNACFKTTITDLGAGVSALSQGYNCVQPGVGDWCSSGACNFDNYVPNTPGLPVDGLQVTHTGANCALATYSGGVLNIPPCTGGGSNPPAGTGFVLVSDGAYGMPRALVSGDIPNNAANTTGNAATATTATTANALASSAWASPGALGTTTPAPVNATTVTAKSVATNDATAPTTLVLTPNGQPDAAPPANSVVYVPPASVPIPYLFDPTPTNVTDAQGVPLPLQCQYFPATVGPPATQPKLVCTLLAVNGLSNGLSSLVDHDSYTCLSWRSTCAAGTNIGFDADTSGSDPTLYFMAATGGRLVGKIGTADALDVMAGSHLTGPCSGTAVIVSSDGYLTWCQSGTYVSTKIGAAGGLGNGLSTGDSGSSYSTLSWNGNYADGTRLGCVARTDGTGDANLYCDVPSGGTHVFRVNNARVGTLNTNGLQLPSETPAACSAATQGTFNYISGGTGVKDTVQVCAKDAADAYAWRAIY